MNVPDLLAVNPDNIAIESGNRRYSYHDLSVRVGRRVDQLTESRARVVALFETDPVQWIIWDLALSAAGCVCVPVPGFFTLAQIRHLLNQTGADTWIGPQPDAFLLTELGFAAGPGDWQRCIAPVAMPVGTAKITFTSGTTGTPKGVCLSGAAMMNVARALASITAEQSLGRHLTLLPMAILLENLGVWAAFISGATVCVRDINVLSSAAADRQAVLHAIAHSDANSMILVPQLLDGLLQAQSHGFQLPASFRFIAVGGGRVAQRLLNKVDDLNWPVYEGYGLSECASVVCLNSPGEHQAGSVGKPLPHLSLTLAADGEIQVHGAGFLGYLGSPHDPDAPLPTGDLGYQQDGHFYINGRKKHQFITAFGRNVSPEWVEAELCSQPEISQAFLYGEALPVNTAILVPTTDNDDAVQTAVDRVNNLLPAYAQVGKWVRAQAPFSFQNEQLTVNGRLRRERILAIYPQFFQQTKISMRLL